jgi:hypothetical protein
MSFMFDGDTINLAALLELRAAGWAHAAKEYI